MKAISLATLAAIKAEGNKFAVITAYDAAFARLAENAGIEALLVGDSLGNVILGHADTVPVTMADMIHHTAAVRRGSEHSLIIADLPFMAYATPEQALANSTALMQAGAHVVKLEGGAWLGDTVRQLSERGIPVCAHLGLTPQSVHKLGGYRVQGREQEAARRMIDEALLLQQAGADLLVVECIPTALGEELSQTLEIPVIGIGAGPGTDAQVLVIYDMLGLSPRSPRFSRDFLAETGTVPAALAAYAGAVRDGSFPGPAHCFD